MNLGELTSLIRSSLRRGNTLDEEIPLYIKQAVEYVERNHKLTYMDRFGVFGVESERTILADTVRGSDEYWERINDARTIRLKEDIRALKVVKRVFFENVNERRYEGKVLEKVEYSEYVEARPLVRTLDRNVSVEGGGERFYLDGKRQLVLDAIDSDVDQRYAISWEAYSEWGLRDDFTHPLLDRASSLIQAQVMVNFAPRLSMPNTRLVQYKDRAQEELKALLNADQDYRYEPPAGFSGADAYAGLGYPQVVHITNIISPEQ